MIIGIGIGMGLDILLFGFFVVVSFLFCFLFIVVCFLLFFFTQMSLDMQEKNNRTLKGVQTIIWPQTIKTSILSIHTLSILNIYISL